MGPQHETLPSPHFNSITILEKMYILTCFSKLSMSKPFLKKTIWRPQKDRLGTMRAHKWWHFEGHKTVEYIAHASTHTIEMCINYSDDSCQNIQWYGSCIIINVSFDVEYILPRLLGDVPKSVLLRTDTCADDGFSSIHVGSSIYTGHDHIVVLRFVLTIWVLCRGKYSAHI